MPVIKSDFFCLLDNCLFVTSKGITESKLSISYFWNLNSEGSDRTQLHPNNKKVLLVKYESLSNDHQKKIKERFGNPYDFIAREPIQKMLAYDDKAEQFFLQYRYNDDKILPVKRVKQYARACCWLNLLKNIEENRNRPIKEIGLSVPEFYKHLDALMQLEKANGMSDTYEGPKQLPSKFPTSYRKLRPKLEEYIKTGYSSIIDKMYGNQIAAKISDEISEAHLLSLIENPNQFDDVLVAYMYNLWAKENSYKIITPASVGVWRRKKESFVIAGREGNAAYNEKFIRQVKGLLPSTPLALVEHDDYNINALFTDPNDTTTHKDYHRYVSIIVFDARTKLVLGKSYKAFLDTSFDGKTGIRPYQIHHAYLDAMYYIRSITGAWHLPFEIKSDKWALSSMLPFYNKIAKFVPPSHGNKHRGYIEQFFGNTLMKRCEKLIYDKSYNGNNMTAINRGYNEDNLRLNIANRPKVGDEAEQKIEDFFHLLRTMPDIKRSNMNAPSKEQQFIEQWNQLHIDDKRPINDEQFLLTFGIKHNPKNPIAITNRGVEPQINKLQYSYDLPESWMYDKYRGAKVNVVYDPFDMSRVLITNFDDIRFIANTAQLTPRALKDYHTGSRTYLNAILNEKKDQVKRAGDAADRRRKLLNETIDANALLKGGVMLKDIKNNAEQALIEQQYSEERGTWLEDNHDFSEFFND